MQKKKKKKKKKWRKGPNEVHNDNFWQRLIQVRK